MLVAATTDCFRQLSLKETLDKLVDLEYSNVEIVIDESGNQVKPSEVASDVNMAVSLCRDTHRMNVVSYWFRTTATGEEYYDQFDACCRLAKATKVVTITVPSGELGTPFNEEVERLTQLVQVAEMQGVRVGVKSQVGCLSEDPDTLVVLCDNVDGLGVTLDPSHYICGPHSGKSYDKLLKYTYHVHLRDTSKDELQVRIGQGEVEYGRLINQLRKSGYDRALSTDVTEVPDLDPFGEMRQMRLLLESLL